jgi:hypothetical protein
MLYLAVRDQFTDPVLLESNESWDNEHYYSIVGLETLASFTVNEGIITKQQLGQWGQEEVVENVDTVSRRVLREWSENLSSQPHYWTFSELDARRTLKSSAPVWLRRTSCSRPYEVLIARCRTS